MSSIITYTNCPSCQSVNIQQVLTCKDHTVSGKNFEVWACINCSLRFTQGAPNQDAIGPYYQSENYISHSDTQKGIVNKLYKIARNYTLNWKLKLVKQSSKKTTGRLLDIGAGTGAFVKKLTDAHWQVTGLEPDAGARETATTKYEMHLQTSDELFGLPSHFYDVVTMWHVLEHVHQLHNYLDEIKRVLKNDGVALIALPNYTAADAAYYGANWAAYDVPRHLYHFAPAALKKVAAIHQLRVYEIKPMWLDAFYIAMLSEKYKTGKSNLASALKKGFNSNLKASSNHELCSSVVYILRHENSE